MCLQYLRIACILHFIYYILYYIVHTFYIGNDNMKNTQKIYAVLPIGEKLHDIPGNLIISPNIIIYYIANRILAYN